MAFNMPPDWNDEGQIPDPKALAAEAAVADSGIQNNPTDADPGQAGAPPAALLATQPSPQQPEDLGPINAQRLQEILASQDPSLFAQVSKQLQAQQLAGNVGQPNSQASQSTGKSAAPSDDSDDEDSTPSTPKDYLKDLLGKLYGGDTNDQALKDAMTKRDQQRVRGMQVLIGNQLAEAASRGSYKADPALANEVLKTAGQPVEDVQALRKGKMDQIETGLKASDLSDREKLRDPDSDVSEAYRSMAIQLNPKLASQDNFDQMNAEGIKQLLPMVDMSLKMQMLQIQRQQIQQDKIKMDSAKGKADMGKSIQTLLNRGAPMQAQTTILAADKINDLFNREPEPSKWNSSQVHLFNTETEKLAKGGIPGEQGTNALVPQNLASMFSKAAAFATGDSIGTHQGEVIKSLRNYINDVRGTSANYINQTVINPVTTSFNKRVLPEDMEDYKRNLPDYLRNNTPSDLQQSNANKVKVSNGKETLLIDPSDLANAQSDGYNQVK